MPDSSDAQQRLDALHHLLARERLYRQVSAPTALVAGTLSLTASAFLVWCLASTGSRVLDMHLFFGVWIGVLTLSLLFGVFRLQRESQGEPFLTPAARLVVGTMTPYLLASGALGLLFSWRGAAFSLSITWITLYGLALVATTHFAPRPISNLGWAFLITGVSLMLFVYLRVRFLIGYERSDIQSALLMGATFGLLHILYAFILWAQMRTERRG